MYCPKCGTQNEDNAFQCVQCGQVLQQIGQPPVPTQTVPDNLVWAILTTLFCCPPFGIVSIVYAAQVNGKLAAGDYEGAVQSSNAARTWALAAFVCGLLIPLIYGIIIAISVFIGTAAHL